MFRDIAILGGLSIIYLAMAVTIIRVALFYRNDQRANGSPEHPSDEAGVRGLVGKTASLRASSQTRMMASAIVRGRPDRPTQDR